MSELQLLFEQSFIKESIAEFIRKVYLLLEGKQYQDVIAWASDNRTIVIKDCEKITEEVLPILFKQKTLKSFIRQLNMYSFRKVKAQESELTLYFRNDNFARGNLQNLIFIKRKQRGYVEPSKLENLQSKTTLEKYKIYANGVLSKLRDQFSRLQDKHPEVASQLVSLVKTNMTLPQAPQPSPLNMSQLQMFHPMVQQQRSRLTLLSSMQSFYNIPVFRSSLSIFIEEP